MKRPWRGESQARHSRDALGRAASCGFNQWPRSPFREWPLLSRIISLGRDGSPPGVAWPHRHKPPGGGAVPLRG